MLATPPPPPPATETAAVHEREWHTFAPEPLDGTGNDGVEPLYPVLFGEGCREAGSVDREAVFVCGRDAVRIGARGLEFTPFRSGGGFERKGDLPGAVWQTDDGTVWVETKPRLPRYPGPSDKPRDPFAVYQGSVHRFHDGAWKRFPTVERPARHREGWLVFDLPRLEQPVDRSAPGCADFGCARVLPSFWADRTTAPDFKALEGKLAWIHPYDDEQDWAYVVEPTGPVYVLMRALDLSARPQRRVIGVLSWTEKDGARFDALPGLPGDIHFQASVERPKPGGFRFVLSTFTRGNAANAPPIEEKYEVTRDAKGWSSKKQPRPKPAKPAKPVKDDGLEGYEVPSDGQAVGGYRVNRGGMLERRSGDDWAILENGPSTPQLRRGSRGEILVITHFYSVFRSIQPPEVLTLTDYWGDLHPWPEPAGDDCPHPFAVFDALDEESYGAIVEEASKKGLSAVAPWGSLPREWAHLNLVEFRLFEPPLIVIGASLAPSEVKTLRVQLTSGDGTRKLRPWSSVGIGSERQASGIYCARPVNPTPFTPPP